MKHGAIAQLGERLPCTQEVNGSIPFGSTTFKASMQQQNCLSFRDQKRAFFPVNGERVVFWFLQPDVL
jgi:hypothetical protein